MKRWNDKIVCVRSNGTDINRILYKFFHLYFILFPTKWASTSGMDGVKSLESLVWPLNIMLLAILLLCTSGRPTYGGYVFLSGMWHYNHDTLLSSGQCFLPHEMIDLRTKYFNSEIQEPVIISRVQQGFSPNQSKPTIHSRCRCWSFPVIKCFQSFFFRRLELRCRRNCDWESVHHRPRYREAAKNKIKINIAVITSQPKKCEWVTAHSAKNILIIIIV